jgi:uncharacterized protein (AIM24 family)
MNSLEIYVPEVRALDSKYAISGADCQILSISLRPGELCECEPGSMMMMSPSIKTTVTCGNCSRLCTGEKLCKAIYTNEGSQAGFVFLMSSLVACHLFLVL